MMGLVRRLTAFFRRHRLAEELREEVEHHLELRRHQLVADGLDPREAAAAARRSFGNAVRIREQARDVWAFPLLESVAQDVRFAVRLLLRAPTVTALAVVSLAVGLGSTAAMFGIADAVLFRPLAVRSAHELVQFRATVQLGAAQKQVTAVAPDTLRSMSDAADFARLFGFRTLDDVTLAGGAAERSTVRLELVSADYFEVLGAAPAAGRLLTRDDFGGVPVPLVLSERLWRTRFNADAALIGRRVSLNGTPAVIVGVARAFRGLLAERPADVMAPVDAGALIDPASAASGLRVMARIAPGSAREVVEARMATLYRAVAIDSNSLLQAAQIVVTLSDASGGASDARELLQRPIVVGLALAGLLLLVACANTAGLLAAQFTSRSHEFGVRMAIGAGRVRLVRQLVVEALLLAFLAAVAGLLTAGLTAPLLLASLPVGPIPLDFDLRSDWRLGLFIGLLAATTGAAAAAAPLLRLSLADTRLIITQSSRSIVRGRRRVTQLLVGSQVAASLLLLVAAGAMTRTLINLGRVDPGFDSAGVVAIAVDAAERAHESALHAYYSALRERIAAVPHVARVSFSQVGLMTSAATTGTIDIAGWTPRADADRWVRMFWVGPDFFEAVGMPLVAGQSIGQREATGTERVAVVNRAFADFYFGSPGDAVGRVVNRSIRILGVAADARYGSLRDEPVRAMFVPYTQAPPRGVMTFVVRLGADPSRALAPAVEAIRAHDPALKVRITRLDEQIAATLSRERFVATLASVLSGLALLLSCAGLYGTVAFAVAERRGELAVRMALGATGSRIIRLVVGEPLRIAAVGLIVGIAGVSALMSALQALLFGIAPFDVPTIAVCAAGLMAVTAAAAFWPARRAAAIDPLECLKRG